MPNSAFAPLGPTYLISTSAINVLNPPSQNPTVYRIANITASLARLGWTANPSQGGTGAPAATTPTTAGINNVISMNANTVELFVLPPNAWFISSASNSFEVTPGA